MGWRLKLILNEILHELKTLLAKILANILAWVVFIGGFIVVAAIVLAIVSLFPHPSTATVYFDNGASEPFTIYIDGKDKGVVPSQDLKKVDLKIGSHLVELKRKSGELFEYRDIECEDGVRYVYNIGRLKEYFIETMVYGAPPSSYVKPTPEPLEIDSVFFEMPEVGHVLGEECPSFVMVGLDTTYSECTYLTSYDR